MMMLSGQASVTSSKATQGPVPAALNASVPAKALVPRRGSSACLDAARARIKPQALAVAQPRQVLVHTSVDMTEDEQAEALYWQRQVKAVLGSFSALPIERLHNIIKFTSTNPKLNKSVSEMDLYCSQLLDQGELVRDHRGWLALPDGIPRPAVAKETDTGSSTVATNARTPSPIPVGARVPTPRPSVAAYPPHLRELAPYHYQILGLMSNFKSMPLTRLHTTLALTMISPKFDKTEAQLEQFVAWLVEDGQLACDAQTGWYSYCEPKSPPTTPAPPRPVARTATPALVREAPVAATAAVAVPVAATAAVAAPVAATAAIAAPAAAPARAIAPPPARSPEPEPAAAPVAATSAAAATVPARTPSPSPAPQEAKADENLPVWMPKDERARLPSPMASRGPETPPPAKPAQPEQYGQLATLVTGLALASAVALGFAGTVAAMKHTVSAPTPNVGYQYKPAAARMMSTAVPSAAREDEEAVSELQA